jgi:hypothetical protein
VRRCAPAIAATVAALVGSIPARAGAQPTISTSPEQAYDLGQIPSARAVGMGDALNALGVSTTGLYLNPANMPLARVYHIEALGAYSPEAKRQTYGLGIVDSVENSSHLAGGLGGMWSEIDPSGLHRLWTDVRGALALPLGDHLSLGATGRWLRVDQGLAEGPFGKSLPSDGTPNGPLVNLFTFDAGATASIGDSLRIGLVGHNLINANALAPTWGAAGVGFQTSLFAVEADGMLDFTTYSSVQGRVMLGGELFLADRYAIRAGYRYDTGLKVSTPSLGLGYIDPRWSVELAVRHDLVADHAATLGVLSLRYFYDATGSTTPADEPDSL